MTYFASKSHMLVYMGNLLIWCFRRVKLRHSGENFRSKLIEKKKVEICKLNWDFV